ncbi:MAG: hypothetical protein WB797_10740 [Nocardioides sp.]
MADPYFDDVGARRQAMLWACAAWRQLDRWEPLVARAVWGTYAQGTPPPGSIWWEGESERHFAIVAMDHMLEALNMWSTPVKGIPAIVRDEVQEVRDLVTHWKDNMPVFNVRPRTQSPPRSTGQRFAARNPNVTPFDPLAWNSRRGAMLTKNVSAPEARAAIKAVLDAAVAEAPELVPYLPPEAPSPWFVDEHGNCWPLQAKDL